VKIPAGVDTGARLVLRGEGEGGEGGAASGDLYVVIGVKEHPLFKREGATVVCEVPLTFPQAALGAEIEVPTLEGKLSVRVPEGTQTGRTIRLKGKGLPSLRSQSRGDQLVQIFVETPTKLSRRQRELLEAFAAEGTGEVSPVTKSFLEKLRDLWE
jgi:molecular chaperone DnaJ